MRLFWKPLLIGSLLLCLAPLLVLAQSDCPDIVQTALDAADQACASTGRNQACYGNVDLSAQPEPGAKDFTFNKVGDIVDVSNVKSLTLSPMDQADGKWGVALLRLQADLPDTLPGQNVTFLLFGDVEIENAVAPDDTTQHPMQAFYLRTGQSDAPCDEAPESGMLVQTPEGAEEVSFNVNGVDVQMGSTVLFQADADNGMTVSTLEGAALVGADDGVQVIPPGASSLISLTRELRASGAPAIPISYEGRQRFFRALPLRLLQRRIQIAAPLTREQIAAIRDKIQNGELPCGEAPLPRCAHLRTFLQTAAAICAARRPAQRPRFCARLRNFIQKVEADLNAVGTAVPTAIGALGDTINCDLSAIPGVPTALPGLPDVQLPVCATPTDEP